MNYEGIDFDAIYQDIQTMEPKFCTFGENLFWSWANWQTMVIYEKMDSPPFVGKYYAIRQSNYKKFLDGRQAITDMYNYNLVKMRTGDFCFYCYDEVAKEDLTADHVFPRIKGGTNDMNNIIMVCKTCNSSKGKKDLLKWYMLTRKEFPSPFVLSHYYKQIYHYAVTNKLMEIPFKEVEKMELPFNPRSVLLLHTKVAHRWYFYNWMTDNNS